MNNVAKSSYVTLSEGNLIVTGNTNANNGNVDGTIAPSSGKWYWEAKYVTAESGGGGVYPNIGVYPVHDSNQPKMVVLLLKLEILQTVLVIFQMDENLETTLNHLMATHGVQVISYK